MAALTTRGRTGAGPLRADAYRDDPGPGIAWGLCQDVHTTDRTFLLRFDCVFDD